MATCNDCISFSRCKEMYETFGVSIDIENSAVCTHFKNKANFVEVVRCKDCLWATERIRDNELFSHQCRNTIACGKPRRAIDFCSYGERK